MQVLGCSDAGPWMLGCMYADGVMRVLGCVNSRDGNTVRESRRTFGKNQCHRLNYVVKNPTSQKFSFLSGSSL